MLAHRTQVVTKETVRFGRKTPCLIDVVNGTQEPVYVLLSSYDVEWISVQDTFTELIEPKFMRPLTVDLFDPYCIQVQLAEIFAAFLSGFPFAPAFVIANNQPRPITKHQIYNTYTGLPPSVEVYQSSTASTFSSSPSCPPKLSKYSIPRS